MFAGTLLREFTFGHVRQLESALREHLAGLCQRVDLLPGGGGRAFVDIDSLLRPVYGHAKQGASYGHTKIAGKQNLRKGLSPLITTISTEPGAPLIAGARLRAGKANSGKGAARMIAQAVATARAAGVTGQILVRGDSAYGNSTVVAACRRAGARFSLFLTKSATVAAAIDSISDDASSTSQPGWLDPNAALSCTYQRTGPGRSTGSHCGATLSATAHQRPPLSDHPPTGPTEQHRKSWADQRIQAARHPERGKTQYRNTSTGSIHGSRLSTEAASDSHGDAERLGEGGELCDLPGLEGLRTGWHSLSDLDNRNAGLLGCRADPFGY